MERIFGVSHLLSTSRNTSISIYFVNEVHVHSSKNTWVITTKRIPFSGSPSRFSFHPNFSFIISISLRGRIGAPSRQLWYPRISPLEKRRKWLNGFSTPWPALPPCARNTHTHSRFIQVQSRERGYQGGNLCLDRAGGWQVVIYGITFSSPLTLKKCFAKNGGGRGVSTRLPIRRMLLAFRDRIGQKWIESFKKLDHLRTDA